VLVVKVGKRRKWRREELFDGVRESGRNVSRKRTVCEKRRDGHGAGQRGRGGVMVK
jgi:hypothetical protein